MCAPIIAAGLAIAQAGVGYMAARSQAEAQNSLYADNRRAAIAAANDRYDALQTRSIQEAAALSQEKTERQIEAMQARATTRAGAAESGVTGLSVDALLGDLFAKQGRAEAILDQNWAMKRGYFEAEMDATQHQTTARINSVPPAAMPSFLPFLVQAAAGAVNAYSQTTARTVQATT